MTALSELQQQFQQHILSAGRDEREALASVVVDPSCLSIYVDMYGLRLAEVLATEFPATKILMGESEFNQVSADYIAAYPARHFSTAAFAQYFSDHIAEQVDNSLFADMAMFEWALSRAIDAADAPVIALADLQALAQEQWPAIQVSFHPAVRALVSEWNIVDLWTAIDQDAAVPTPQQRAETILVWRYQQQPYYQALSANAALCLHCCLSGKNFADICEALCGSLSEDTVAQVALEQLIGWIQQEMVCSLGE